jgi:hypothetical protein
MSKRNWEKVILFPDKYFHITPINLGLQVRLKTSKSYYPIGVSFSPSIEQCLVGVPCFYVSVKKKLSADDWEKRKKTLVQKNIWYVYTPINKEIGIIPEVNDLHITEEARVLHSVRARLSSTIKVSIKRNKWIIEKINILD